MNRVSSVLAVVGVLVSANQAFAQFEQVQNFDGILPPDVQFENPGGGINLGPGMAPTVPAHRRAVRPRPQSAPVWEIPVGKYGLQLNDGTKVIGIPGKGWSASVKTGFGTVTIPRDQIDRIEPAANGEFSIHLKNGDRVTGGLVSARLPFDTSFGTLDVPCKTVVRLASATPPARKPVPAPKTPSAGNGALPNPGVEVDPQVQPIPFQGDVQIQFGGGLQLR